MADFDAQALAPHDIGGKAVAASTFSIEPKELAEWELRMVCYPTALTFVHARTRVHGQIDEESINNINDFMITYAYRHLVVGCAAEPSREPRRHLQHR